MKKHSKIGLLALLLALACTLALLPTTAFAAGTGGEATGVWDEDTQGSDGHFLMAVPRATETEGQGGWSVDDFDDGSAHIVIDDNPPCSVRSGRWILSVRCPLSFVCTGESSAEIRDVSGRMCRLFPDPQTHPPLSIPGCFG